MSTSFTLPHLCSSTYAIDYRTMTLQVFAIELVTFAVDFIPLAVEFGTFAVDVCFGISCICTSRILHNKNEQLE